MMPAIPPTASPIAPRKTAKIRAMNPRAGEDARPEDPGPDNANWANTTSTTTPRRKPTAPPCNVEISIVPMANSSFYVQSGHLKPNENDHPRSVQTVTV